MKTKTKQITAIIIVLLLLAVAFVGYTLLSTSQELSIDVNPSIHIGINRMNRVIRIQPLNSDAQRLLAGYKGKGKLLEEVTEDIVDRMILEGYLVTDLENEILVTVKDGKQADKTKIALDKTLSQHLEQREIPTSLYMQKIYWDNQLEHSAQVAGVSPGKLALAMDATGGDEELSYQAANLPLSEITSLDSGLEQHTIAQPEQLPTEELPAENESTSDVALADGPLTQQEAMDIFASFYPTVPVQKAELQEQGEKFYLYGELDGVHYKMNVLTADGTVVYHYPPVAEIPAQEPQEQPNQATDSTPQSSTPAETPQGSVSAEQAQAKFENSFGISPQKTQLQDGGKVYYMYAESGGVHHKMKVRVSDGAVVYQYPSSNGTAPAENSSSQSEQTAADTPAVTEGEGSSGAISEAQAQAMFLENFGLSPQKTELQDGGKVYYMYAESSGTHYKLKVRVSDGAILYSNAGGRGGSQRGNSQRGGRR